MNHHFANAGDVMKHLALMRVVDLMRPRRYLEAHAGGFDYPLMDREGPLPDGVWDFLAAAPAVGTLADSAYLGLLQRVAGTPASPGIYPGSMRCVAELLGPSAVYLANDTDPAALLSLRQALDSRGVQAAFSARDGLDAVIDEAAAGDLVLLDPFDPDATSPAHGLSAVEAFDVLVERGVAVLLWRATHGEGPGTAAIAASDLTVCLRFDERTGSMDGCDLILGNVGADVAAEVARLAVAHGAILNNGRLHLAGARRPLPAVAGRAKPEGAPAHLGTSAGDLFDRYVMVDWSAKSTPSPLAPTKDAIWIGDLAANGQGEIYCTTRAAAFEETHAILGDAVEKGQRVLIGFDFPFGYPRGFAAAMGLDTQEPWKSVWLDLAERITDDAKNVNNRFDVARSFNERTGPAPGPFWGCPDAHDFGGLTKKSKGLLAFPYQVTGGQLEKFRTTEVLIPGTVQETWKLTGNGSVGSQALVGINRVAQLRFHPDFDAISQVWPFETGLTTPDLPRGATAIIFAEIWPGIVDAGKLEVLMAQGLIRDQAQVRLMCEWASEHDEAGRLGQYLAPPQALDGHADSVVSEEGWILGCL